MRFHYYGDITPEGIYLDPDIKTNLLILNNVIRALKEHNLILLGFNEQGIVIEYYVDPSLIIDASIAEINSKLRRHLDRIQALESDQLKLDFKEDTPPIEVPEGFYILYDLLPEKTKKELKIYIQKS